MESHAPAKPGVPWRTWTLLGILAILLLVLLVPRLVSAHRWGRYIDRLRDEPGIVVTDQGRQGGRFVVRGLRDPLARDPAALLANTGLEPDDIAERWEPYVALLPQFVLSRATRILAPPPTVSLRLAADTLVASGAGQDRWFRRAAQLAPALPGIGGYREERVLPRDIPQFAPVIQGLETRRVYFALGRADLDSLAQGTVALMAGDILQLDSLARQAGFTLGITLVGSADDLGTPETNQRLRAARAGGVRDRLAGALPGGIVLATTELAEAEPPSASDEERARRRSVLARVELLPPSEPDGTPP
jgi:OOP family OmpA-OmpF porin